jgi:hypothetical protein
MNGAMALLEWRQVPKTFTNRKRDTGQALCYIEPDREIIFAPAIAYVRTGTSHVDNMGANSDRLCCATVVQDLISGERHFKPALADDS